jgi:hypothetical protein
MIGERLLRKKTIRLKKEFLKGEVCTDFPFRTLILSNGQGNFTLVYLQNEYVALYVKYVLQTIETTNLLCSTATVYLFVLHVRSDFILVMGKHVG